MGCCGTSEDPDSAAISKQNAADHRKDQAVKKLLLLGAGESGKSTLFKQMITLYGRGFPEEERRGYTHIVHQNTISAINILVQFAAKLQESNPQCKIAATDSVEFIKGLNQDSSVQADTAQHIIKLWADPGVQATYDLRANFQLPDSAEYFIEKVDEIANEDYVPSEQDILRSRVRTTGIVETEFKIKDNLFRMFDVGGQRNERKKWIHCFEDVTCVIFVAAISEYDQVLYEDENTNRMAEALNLFDEICNSRWFENTSVILFLNKKDLFEQKINNNDFEEKMLECFPEYPGGRDFNVAASFIQQEFMDKNQHPDKKEIYPHVTCATDTGNVGHVFSAVKDIIIKESLSRAGLMG